MIGISLINVIKRITNCSFTNMLYMCKLFRLNRINILEKLTLYPLYSLVSSGDGFGTHFPGWPGSRRPWACCLCYPHKQMGHNNWYNVKEISHGFCWSESKKRYFNILSNDSVTYLGFWWGLFINMRFGLISFFFIIRAGNYNRGKSIRVHRSSKPNHHGWRWLVWN